MKSLKKMSLMAIMAIVLLSGCQEVENKSPKKTSSSDIKVFCDKDTNIEYLLYDGYKAGGLTLRVSPDGTPKRCN